MIVFFGSRGQGQPILGKEDHGPEHHMVKQGTPTMGGLAIVVADAATLDNPRAAGMRISTDPEDMVILHAMHAQMAEAVAKFPAADWAALAAEVGVPVQRSSAGEQ